MKHFDEWWATLTTREQARMVRDDVAEAWDTATKAEREACADACEAQTEGFAVRSKWDDAALSCARAIRMRSNANVTGAEPVGEASELT